MSNDNEQFVAGMAHCYHVLAQEVLVKREAFNTVWDFYYEHPEASPNKKIAEDLAFASSVMEHMENALESAYFDALDNYRDKIEDEEC